MASAKSATCSSTRGSDGIDYSASVAGNSVPVGAPKISDAVEGSPTTFDANGVAPQGGTGAITYEWRFQRDGCGFDACGGSALENNQIVFLPEYGDPVSGATVQHTWQEFDTHFVELTAVAANGLRTTLQMQLPVGNVPPTLELLPDCALGEAGGDCTPRTVPPGSNVALGGVFDDAGDLSTLSVSINWGDGTSEASRIEPDGSSVSSPVVLTKYVDETQNVDAYRFSGHHTYGAVGTYYGTVTVTDGHLFFNYGDSESKTFVITVGAQEQAIGFAALPSRTYGEEPFALAVTGGASGEPVTFDVTGSGSVCAVSTAPTGEPTVTLLGAGTCHITASQAGSGPYAAAESVTQSFDILPAPVVVHAVSLGMWYDGTVPGTGPFYEGLVHDDWPDTDATCTVDVPSGGPIRDVRGQLRGRERPQLHLQLRAWHGDDHPGGDGPRDRAGHPGDGGRGRTPHVDRNGSASPAGPTDPWGQRDDSVLQGRLGVDPDRRVRGPTGGYDDQHGNLRHVGDTSRPTPYRRGVQRRRQLPRQPSEQRSVCDGERGGDEHPRRCIGERFGQRPSVS